MKPLLLKIKGLNSFIEEQSIDFSLLSKNGLFGIFGPTGSGKSTIIDAITFALFGEMSRYDGERGGRQFINSLSDSMWVYFKFMIHEKGKDAVYTVEKSYRKTDAAPRIVLARLSRIDGENTEILADKASVIHSEIENLIGLSYKDFTRSVVLPQGRFSQFLLLVNAERRNMLERIFSLEDYGDAISSLVKAEANAAGRDLALVQNKLQAYGALSREYMENMEKELGRVKNMLAVKTQSLSDAEKEFEALSQLHKAYEEFSAAMETKNALLEKQGETDGLRSLERKLSGASRILPLYNEFKEINHKYHQVQTEHIRLLPDFEQAAKEEAHLKAAYENAVAARENTLKPLMEKQQRLAQAIELLQSAEKSDEEVALLRNQFKDLSAKIAGNSKEMDKYKENARYIHQELQKIAEGKAENHVDPRYREDIEHGRSLQSVIKQAALRAATANTHYRSAREQLDQYNMAAKEAVDAIEKLHACKTKQAMVIEQLKLSPGTTREAILKLRETIVSETARYDSLKDKRVAYLAALSEFSEAQEQLRILNEKMEEATKTELACRKNFEEAATDLEAFERQNMAALLAKGLSAGAACPVCGSKDHPLPAKALADSVMEGLQSLYRESRQALDQSIEEAARLRQSLLQCQKTMDSMEKKHRDYGPEVIRFDEKAAKEALSRLKAQAESAENQQALFEKRLQQEETNYYEIEKDILKQESAQQSAKEAAKKTTALLGHWEKELKEAETGKNSSQRELDKLIKKTGVLDFDGAYKNITLKSGNYAALEQEETRLNKEYEQIKTQSDQFKDRIAALEKRLEAVKVSGTQMARLAQQQKDQADRLAPGADPLKELPLVKEEIKEMTEQEAALKAGYSQISSKLQQIYLNKKGLEDTLAAYNSTINNQNARLHKILEEEGFKSKEEFIETAEQIPSLAEISARIKNYDLALSQAESRIHAVSPVLERMELSGIDGRVKASAQAIAAAKEEITSLSTTAAITQKELEACKAGLETAETLKKEETRLVRRTDLLDDLTKLFEGKRFVEYAAKRELDYITRDASKRLKEMSGGRFALELDGADFVVRDDYNGGLRRSPRTLSGGETFMASLCLALALSAKVQLKSRSALEFFFLDEGFGSLDQEALNTVMDSLMNLRKQNMNIGIISHVDELKGQIPVKLIVSPPTVAGTGSKVSIE